MQNIKITCICCHQPVEIPGVDSGALSAIQAGRAMCMSIQDIIPNVSPAYREMFISGICPECWNKMFGCEEEDEDELVDDSSMELA